MLSEFPCKHVGIPVDADKTCSVHFPSFFTNLHKARSAVQPQHHWLFQQEAFLWCAKLLEKVIKNALVLQPLIEGLQRVEFPALQCISLNIANRALHFSFSLRVIRGADNGFDRQ